MKAITLMQPWASLVAFGFKKYETRSFRTRHRGDLLIHAGLQSVDPWKANLMRPEVWTLVPVNAIPMLYKGAGKALCVVTVEDCIPASEVSEAEQVFGDFAPGRWAWRLGSVRLIRPMPMRGKQGLWNVEWRDEWIDALKD